MTINPSPPASSHAPTQNRRDVGDTNVCWRCGLPILRRSGEWVVNGLVGVPPQWKLTCPGAPFDLHALGKEARWLPQVKP